MINLSLPTQEAQLRPRITVVGCGGAGGNAVNNMIRANLEGVEFLTANTDAQALAGNLAERKLQLGVTLTQGLGAGSRPEVGRAAAEEAIEQITGYLEGSHMVFITAGMGGGTGTGAAPVIARAARDQGVLTVGVVTKPFHFEGALRMKIAEQGLKELQEYVDTLIVIPNQNLFRIANEKTTFADAFKMADDVLHSGVRGVTDLMVMPGLINLDFADIRTVMAEMGKAMMGTGQAEGDRRAVMAAEAAISNPLLDDVSMKGARGVLINITGGLDMTLYEVDEAANRIRDEVDPEANIIFGAIFDESLEGRVRVSVVATGIDAEEGEVTRPVSVRGFTVVGGTASGNGGGSAATKATATEPRPVVAVEEAVHVAEAAPTVAAAPAAATMAYAGGAATAARVAVAERAPEAAPAAIDPVVTQPVPVAPTPAPTTRPTMMAARSTTTPRAERREGAFIPPRPVESPMRPQVSAPPPATADAFADAEVDNGGRMADRRRGNSIFQRMTGLLRNEDGEVHAAAPAPQSAAPAAKPQAPMTAAQPAMQAAPTRPVARTPAAQPQARLDVSSRPLPRQDDDSLEIPAFLRRQAN
ncbi:MAG: cell division protein FtsZ [Rhodospirillaceae bacterium]|nr:cell division protein FtsZ [Rhodospirillaceae bacterium]